MLIVILVGAVNDIWVWVLFAAVENTPVVPVKVRVLVLAMFKVDTTPDPGASVEPIVPLLVKVPAFTFIVMELLDSRVVEAATVKF